MKKFLFIFLSCVFFSRLLFAAEFPWQKKKDAQGIQVYVRPVEGSPLVEYKGVTVVDAPLEKVLALYEDAPRMTEWFHQCEASRLFEEKSPNDKILYFSIEMPWPVKHRDTVYRRVRYEDPKTGAVEYHASVMPGYYPEQPGRIRMPAVRGFWRFTPLEKNRTEVYYQQHGDTGGHIPAWLVNKLAVNIPYESLLKFREIVSKKSST